MSKPEAFLPRPEPEAAVRGGRGGWRDRQTDRQTHHTTTPPAAGAEVPGVSEGDKGPKAQQKQTTGRLGGGGDDDGTRGRTDGDRRTGARGK